MDVASFEVTEFGDGEDAFFGLRCVHGWGHGRGFAEAIELESPPFGYDASAFEDVLQFAKIARSGVSLNELDDFDQRTVGSPVAAIDHSGHDSICIFVLPNVTAITLRYNVTAARILTHAEATPAAHLA